MTNKINDGGAAFPSPTVPIDRRFERFEFEYGVSGMTLRDYFAAKSLPIICEHAPNNASVLIIASKAYEMADAMLKAREEQP